MFFPVHFLLINIIYIYKCVYCVVDIDIGTHAFILYTPFFRSTDCVVLLRFSTSFSLPHCPRYTRTAWYVRTAPAPALSDFFVRTQLTVRNNYNNRINVPAAHCSGVQFKNTAARFKESKTFSENRILRFILFDLNEKLMTVFIRQQNVVNRMSFPKYTKWTLSFSTFHNINISHDIIN